MVTLGGQARAGGGIVTDSAMASGSDQELAAAIDFAAARADLGRRRQTYLRVPLRPGGFITAAVLSAAALTGLVVAVVAGQPALGVPGLIFPVFLVPALIVGYRRARSYRGARLELFDAGLVAVREGRLWVARYDRTAVYQDIYQVYRRYRPVRTVHTYTITDLDGVNFVIGDGISNPDYWGTTIVQAVTEAQLPSARSALRSGRRLTFGDLWMSWHEIGSARDSASWSQITEVSIAGGVIVVRATGRRFALASTPVSGVANLRIFLALVDDARRAHGGLSR